MKNNSSLFSITVWIPGNLGQHLKAMKLFFRFLALIWTKIENLEQRINGSTGACLFLIVLCCDQLNSPKFGSTFPLVMEALMITSARVM